MVKIGINGFGRIGRLSMRAAWNMPELEIIHVNEIMGGANTAAYMLQVCCSVSKFSASLVCKQHLQFDSVHGRCNHECVAAEDGKSFTVDEKKVAMLSFFRQVDGFR